MAQFRKKNDRKNCADSLASISIRRHSNLSIYHQMLMTACIVASLIYFPAVLDIYRSDITGEFSRTHRRDSFFLPHHSGIEETPSSLLFILTICQETAPEDKSFDFSSLSQQVMQAAVLIKSAASLTSQPIRFLILSDNKLIFNSILQTTYKWPEFYLSKVQLEYHNLRYTKEGLQLKHLLNECAIAKLFIPDLLKYEDAAVFMDADVLFLTSPENFWDEFKDFKDNHVASVSRNLLHLGNAEMNATTISYYRATGLDPSVMMMNFTRMRSYFGKSWTETTMDIIGYFKNETWLEYQDIFNFVFREYPEYFHALSCKWNFSPRACYMSGLPCLEAFSDGAGLIHGTNSTFISGNEPMFKAVFDAWKQHNMGASLPLLLDTLRRNLHAVVSKDDDIGAPCLHIPQIVTALSKQLQVLLQRNQSK